MSPAIRYCNAAYGMSVKILGNGAAKLAKIFVLQDWVILRGKVWNLHVQCRANCKIANNAVVALIVGEDRRFYKHYGFDPIGIARAIWWLVTRGVWTGGSTIEQQLVRTLTGRYERTFRRKLREILLASLVQEILPKSDVARLYLSVAFFGWQMNGIQQACGRLGINIESMDRQQAASLVARLKYPEPKEASERRRRQITMREKHISRLLAPGNVASEETLTVGTQNIGVEPNATVQSV